MREIITYDTNRRTIKAISYRDLVSQMKKGESLLVKEQDLSGMRQAAYWLKSQNYGRWITKPVADGDTPAIMLMRID